MLLGRLAHLPLEEAAELRVAGKAAFHGNRRDGKLCMAKQGTGVLQTQAQLILNRRTAGLELEKMTIPIVAVARHGSERSEIDPLREVLFHKTQRVLELVLGGGEGLDSVTPLQRENQLTGEQVQHVLITRALCMHLPEHRFKQGQQRMLSVVRKHALHQWRGKRSGGEARAYNIRSGDAVFVMNRGWFDNGVFAPAERIVAVADSSRAFAAAVVDKLVAVMGMRGYRLALRPDGAEQELECLAHGQPAYFPKTKSIAKSYNKSASLS